MLYVNIVFIVILSVYLYWLYGLIRTLRSDAPFVPVSQEVLESMVSMVHPKPGDLWIDLGSGDGKILIAACRKYAVKGIGIERISALRWYSRLRIAYAGLSDKIKIRSGNFFNADLSKADVVSFYLLPETNKRLLPKLRAELKPGACIMSHRFEIPGIVLERQDTQHKVYMARAPF